MNNTPVEQRAAQAAQARARRNTQRAERVANAPQWVPEMRHGHEHVHGGRDHVARKAVKMRLKAGQTVEQIAAALSITVADVAVHLAAPTQNELIGLPSSEGDEGVALDPANDPTHDAKSARRREKMRRKFAREHRHDAHPLGNVSTAARKQEF